MRLGVDATLLLPGKSGIGYHTELLVQALARTGQVSEILLFSNRRPVFDGGQPVIARWPGGSFPWRAPWMHLLLPGLLRRTRPDLMHYVNFNAPVLHKHPFVVTFHDMVLFTHPQFFGWKKRRLTRRLIPEAARRALGILATTEAVRREIVEILRVDPEKVYIVPAAPADTFRPEADPARLAAVRNRYRLEAPYLLFVGNLEPRKNLARLLLAFDLFKQELRAPHLLAVAGGQGWKSDPVFHTFESIAHRGDVRFLDYVPLADLSALYAAAEMLLFPSLCEGFGVPPLEAMRCGTPALVSDIPSLREVTAGAAWMVDPLSTGSIAEGIRRVVEDGALREDLRHRGFERSGLYTWDRSARAALDAYRAALSR